MSETLRQIVKGVRAAQQDEDCAGAQINPTVNQGLAYNIVEKIQFDVAVTVSAENEKQGKASIGVASVFGLGIGGQATSITTSSSASRIKFDIPVILPQAGRR